MKLLVLAFYAQFRVGAGRMGVRASRNGMRGASRTSLRHLFVDAECLFCLQYIGSCDPVLGRSNVCGYVLMIKPIMRCEFSDAVDRCSLPCVEAADCGSGLFSSRPDGAYHCRMKLCLQKRLGADSASFGKTSRLLHSQILYGLQCVSERQSSRGTW